MTAIACYSHVVERCCSNISTCKQLVIITLLTLGSLRYSAEYCFISQITTIAQLDCANFITFANAVMFYRSSLSVCLSVC